MRLSLFRRKSADSSEEQPGLNLREVAISGSLTEEQILKLTPEQLKDIEGYQRADADAGRERGEPARSYVSFVTTKAQIEEAWGKRRRVEGE